jgi:hypothetical protein
MTTKERFTKQPLCLHLFQFEAPNGSLQPRLLSQVYLQPIR